MGRRARRVTRDVGALMASLTQAPARGRALKAVFEAWLDADDEDEVTLVTSDGSVVSLRPPSSPGALEAVATATTRPATATGAEGARGSWLEHAARELGAEGPRSYAGYERAFREHVVALDLRLAAMEERERAAVAAELAPARARFASALASYHRNAAAAWASGGRRPLLVCDVPERAAEAAAERQARGTHVLWLDSMRADAWDRLRRSLERTLGGRIAVLSEWLHWTAPEGTARAQVDLFGRGPVALVSPSKDGRDPPAGESTIETAAVPRRVWLGRQEVAWVDVYGVARTSWEKGLDSLYDRVEAALVPALARWLEELPRASVVAVIGDRGFRDAGAGRNPRFVDGGGTPEEALAPAALLWTTT